MLVGSGEAGSRRVPIGIDLERRSNLIPAAASSAVAFRLGAVAGRLDEAAELTEGDLGRPQVERPGDPHGVPRLFVVVGVLVV